MSNQPRILCLHGGGVSAKIFERQMRYFIKSLEHDFRPVFADGPWLSEMHDDLKPVYSHMGPCYRWANWKPHHAPMNDASAIREIESALVKAMSEDEGQGEWVGLVGFSQGAALAFSILLENQLRLERDPSSPGFAGVHWQFGVIMAGRGPPFSMSPHTQLNHHFKSLTQLPQGRKKSLRSDPFATKLRTPTLHVHGLGDGGLELHRDLLKQSASPAHSMLVEWEGAHRIPFRSTDVNRITEAIREVANFQQPPAKYAPIPGRGVFDLLSRGYLVVDSHDKRAIMGPSGDITTIA
ncbi:MAG: hypothetical protein OHK93_007368 [Ramalina farinacea]|uniref:Serine hydrolase domain-containing protein n=1 Tax=Ramalina farinacea TaxID=258253 RepID=A0AA43QM26_9LECA|nr:hypothetical protein [Ramalina farinacea]